MAPADASAAASSVFRLFIPAADSTLGLRLKRIDWGQSIYTMVEPLSPMAPADASAAASSVFRLFIPTADPTLGYRLKRID